MTSSIAVPAVSAAQTPRGYPRPLTAQHAGGGSVPRAARTAPEDNVPVDRTRGVVVDLKV